ncbi:hypothetical protein SAMN04515672_2886 [Natronorubrum texcoconense]|uniref:Uncharacterized protein n=2 Tax=Natronorubrum texcoconense TaxID=1095776 RepID=A0A1G9BC88_9EURY|nr:hypothetical protein SAMN04515672_2886 [Natronorubrum texcoconense]
MRSTESRSFVDGPSMAAGVYVGLLGYLAGAVAGVDGTGRSVGFWLLAVAVALALGGRPELWVAFGHRRLLAVPMFAAMVPGIGLILVDETVGAVDVSLSVLFPLVGLMAVGLALWILGNRVYADRAAGDVRARWVANRDPRRRRWMHAGTVALVVGSVGAFAAVLYGLPSFFLSGAVAGIVILQISVRRHRTYEACEHGLRYIESGTVATSFRPWDRFDGYHETDGAVVLERRWRLDERMAGDEVPAAARDALEAAIGGSSRRE